ncbi:MAG: 4Fe-4S dicluster domain-containing protein [Deltaproteobacteria bacterium]|nr:4Fe-4S dicluster domain-containing protein [Deltaproteobacteria bacterium]
MPTQVYHDLREQMDQYSIGFPSTESGVELKILERLFTEEEADMYLNLSMMLETPEAVAQRIGRDRGKVTATLERMVDKGLIFRLKKGGSAKYGAVPFVVGSFEFQLKDLDKELAQLCDQYFAEALGKDGIAQIPPLRTVPVNKSIDYSWPVMPYEDIKGMVKGKEKISVAKCICRVQQGLLDKGCGKPLEVCFQFGSHADYYVDKGMARYITQEEALQILDKCDEAGLVPQPITSQELGGMCNCCGDCCGILRAIKYHPKPAERVLANYYAEVNPDLCSACETCVDRCQMEAIRVGEKDVAEVDRDRCIGCGLCVTTCPSEALTLKPKPQAERREPPATAKDYMMQVTASRGKSLIPLAVLKKA